MTFEAWALFCLTETLLCLNPGPSAGSPARGRAFRQGLVTQAANPNLLVYFTAILPEFFDPRATLAPQVALLAASSFAIEQRAARAVRIPIVKVILTCNEASGYS